MVLDKDTFLPAASRKVQGIRKGLKSNLNQQQNRTFTRKLIHKTWKRLEGSRLYEHFFVYILHL